jgi:lysylphosphatidylglycerol synthetase-like protein (DUF2156 family)
MKAVLRALMILIDPFAEWTKIEKEPGDPVYLMISYVALLALVPAVFGFIGSCVIGVIVPGIGPVRASLFNGLFGTIFGYLEAFVLVLLLGAIINLVAPLFDGRRDFASALKLAVYSYTPVWLAGIFLVLPGLRFLGLTAFYGAYVLWTGLPQLTKSPEQNAPTYAAVIVVAACALIAVAAAAQRALFGAI